VVSYRFLDDDLPSSFGRFQYGDLHFPQTVGTTVCRLGTHSWPHRSQRQPSICIFATPRDCRTLGFVFRGVTLGILLLGN
jgi:hypothetical protein